MPSPILVVEQGLSVVTSLSTAMTPTVGDGRPDKVYLTDSTSIIPALVCLQSGIQYVQPHKQQASGA